MSHERLTLQDTPLSAIGKLSDGNPGAVRVCVEMLREGERIDPDAFAGGLAPLVSLDSFAIYGADIWCLYKDVCKENLVHTIAALRAVQLGFLSQSKLKHAIQNRGDGVDPVALFETVCDRLPRFKAANALEAETVSVV